MKFVDKLREISKLCADLADEFEKAAPPQPDMGIMVVRMSSRLRHCLINEGISTLGELAAIPEAYLRRSPNLGAATLREAKEILTEHGLHLS